MAEITVMLSAAFKAAYLELVPGFERATGHTVVSLWVPTVQILRRLRADARPAEGVDAVIMSAAGIDELVASGVVDERADLARSGIGVAVRAGAARPDISCADALRSAVLETGSIVYSTGPSGVYLADLFERMGISDEIAHKVKQVQGEPAGAVVARGEAQLGFQQVSELLPVPGIDLVGPLPDDVQEITTFAAGILAGAQAAEAARALVRHFTSAAAEAVIRRSGMTPASNT